MMRRVLACTLGMAIVLGPSTIAHEPLDDEYWPTALELRRELQGIGYEFRVWASTNDRYGWGPFWALVPDAESEAPFRGDRNFIQDTPDGMRVDTWMPGADAGFSPEEWYGQFGLLMEILDIAPTTWAQRAAVGSFFARQSMLFSDDTGVGGDLLARARSGSSGTSRAPIGPCGSSRHPESRRRVRSHGLSRCPQPDAIASRTRETSPVTNVADVHHGSAGRTTLDPLATVQMM